MSKPIIHDGDRVRVKMAQSDLSQKELANMIGVSTSTLSRMLDEASWRTDYLRIAGEVFDVNFFEVYQSERMDEGPVLGILFKPGCLQDPDLIKNAKEQLLKKE